MKRAQQCDPANANKQHLAIHLPNWLGDVIMTLPSLDALNSAGFTFELFGKPWIKDLFSAYPYVTHVIPNKFWEARRLFQKSSANQAIIYTNGLSRPLQLAGTQTKSVGYYQSKIRSMLLHRSKHKPAGLHEIEYFWQLTQFAVKKPLLIPQNPKLLIADVSQQQADDLVKKHHIKSDFIMICPGAIGHGTQRKSKVWPHWQSLCKRLSKQGISLVACPAPFETRAFSQAFGQYVQMLPNIGLPLYAALMQRANHVLCNDSGPMHLAAAVTAPVLGIFGQSDPKRTQPWGGNYIGELNNWPSFDEVMNCLTL